MAIDAETQKVVETFLDEAREALQEIEPTLLELENLIGSDEATGVINGIFGVYHSVKGSAGLLEFNEIERVTHSAETALQKVRDGDLALDGSLVDLFCQGLDFVRGRLDAIAESGTDTGDEEAADQIIQKFASFVPELEEEREEPAILLFMGDDIVAVEDDGTGEVIDDPPELRDAAPFESASEPLPAEILEQHEEDELLAGEPAQTFEMFAGEATILLDECAAALDRIEHGEEDEAVGHAAWQALHNLQVACGYLGLADLQLVAQMSESVVAELRALNGTWEANPGAIREISNRVRSGLAAMRDGVLSMMSGGEGRVADIDAVASRVLGGGLEIEATRLGEILLQAEYVNASTLAQAVARQKRRPQLGEVLVEMEEIEPEELEAALRVQQEKREGKKPTSPLPPRKAKHETLRVDVSKVDRLMDLVGELIIGVTSVTHHPDVQGLGSDHFDKSAAQLSRITRDMQDVAMSLRMVPVRNTFIKMKRLVRDLSKRLGKQIRLDITGEETEVDKSVAEVIADPLVHLVRNSLDHGLEPPDERTAAGKDPEGVVHLTARHQGGEVWIEIIDDGRGIDRERVYERAKERGLTSTPIAELTDREINNFIFSPGFSTAQTVSEVSGRGMGMDVVRRNIESVNGRIEIDSELGKGTRTALRIPLTLAIIEGMLVRVGRSCFTIPLLQIKESMVVPTEDVTVLSNGQEIVKIRDQLLPLVRMHHFYAIQSDFNDVGKGIVMVVEDAGVPICLFVDELIGQRQTVIKGLTGYLRAIRGLSGCTVLGDGRISFILDVASLRSHAVAQGVA
ncbi:MAG: chemotaxis protein CheA [Myxococcota bacterium]